MIAIVAAIARKGAIGYQGRMPWDVPEAWEVAPAPADAEDGDDE